ncbi:MAG: Bifunctional NAD(P)H-hydrate repair enzyme Nnr [Chlamydiae bacterium]|nr:Bifunctional NAD(P)H-hydrate repair enzyme Nnr [Chlamydiota bacterium]
MKIVTPKEMARIESVAYSEGASEELFMEAAGQGVAEAVLQFCQDLRLGKRILLLCAKGNNSGDAYVAGTCLKSWGYHVAALQLAPISECSPLCQKNHKRFEASGGMIIDKDPNYDVLFDQCDVIVDGMFGTGFHGELREPYQSVVKMVNESELPTIAIDIPSGLNGETGEGEGLHATETIYLGLPKQGFFLEGGWNHVGNLTHVNFGLEQKYIDQAKSSYRLITLEQCEELRPPITRNRHKYQAGVVIGLAGSPSMPGAALLASFAALRGGAGMMRLLHPVGMEAELSSSPYELIKLPYQTNDYDGIVENLNHGKAVFFGPGIGRTEATVNLCKNVLPRIETPCVIDADALTILSEHEIALPKQTVLTPHSGEMARLLRVPSPKSITADFLDACRDYCEKKQVTLILKGGPSWIFHPGEPTWVNPTGTPGMATAGSGDVLTGLIASLISQGLTPYHAAIYGVFTHGLAGEIAATEKTPYSMVASDIIEALPSAFWEMMD